MGGLSHALKQPQTCSKGFTSRNKNMGLKIDRRCRRKDVVKDVVEKALPASMTVINGDELVVNFSFYTFLYC